MFENAKWIWNGRTDTVDQHMEFVDSFKWNGGDVSVSLSVDGDYTLWVNGVYAASNQYGDMEHYKIYDTIDVTSLLREGENRLAILVWHPGGEGFMRYQNFPAGLIYEVHGESGVLAASSENTLSRQSKAYESGRARQITSQLGYSFNYFAEREDCWLTESADGFIPSEVTDKNCTFYPRPDKKLTMYPYKEAKCIRSDDEGKHWLLDLGEETVGVLQFSLSSALPQKILVSYGESLTNGHVRRLLGDRDFSIEYHAKPGENDFAHYMLRFSCRYLEVDCEEPITIHSMGLIPQNFEVIEKPNPYTDPLDKGIYQISVNALKLCMMEHYVDTPWREQCLYAYDSRNQMLCGYYAFEDGNYGYARSNLLLLSKALRKDGLLPICSPTSRPLTIPSFSMQFIIAMQEYLAHSKDTSLPEETFDVMTTLLHTFKKQIHNGVAQNFTEAGYWNFFDWSPYADGGSITGKSEGRPHLLTTAVLIAALDGFAEICRTIGRENPFAGLADELRKGAYQKFYCKEKKLIPVNETEATELENAMAVYTGIVTGEEARIICDKIAADELIPCSLSLRPFKYDALIMTDKAAYSDYILAEIRRDYGKMLEAGSTTVWETQKGVGDFGSAGSLCHGWSAVPVYYFDVLLGRD